MSSEGKEMKMLQFVNISERVILMEKELERKLLGHINLCISHALKNPLNSLMALNYLNASLIKKLRKIFEDDKIVDLA